MDPEVIDCEKGVTPVTGPCASGQGSYIGA
jgi:hypothetical protein